MLAGSFPARPARPVADAPLAALADADALAKGWLLTLIAEAPLSAVARLPAGDLATEAPRLCGAVVGALASEAELDRLRDGGDLSPLAARAGQLAGAPDAASAAVAIGALRASLWSAVTDALARPEPELVAALAGRLAYVCDVVAAGALAASSQLVPAPVADPEADSGDPPRLSPVPDLPVQSAPVAVAEPSPESQPDPERVVPADVFPSAAAVHDDRSEPWATAVMRRLGRLVAEGVPCAVLAVDVDDADRLLAGDVRGEAAAALDRAERAVRDELRPGDAAVRERDGRLWIVAGGTGLEGARALARRLSSAVATAALLQGAPLLASIGIAVCPDDGTDSAALVAHADEGVYAARAAGVPLA